MNNWNNYHKITNNKPPRKNIIKFIRPIIFLFRELDLGIIVLYYSALLYIEIYETFLKNDNYENCFFNTCY